MITDLFILLCGMIIGAYIGCRAMMKAAEEYLEKGLGERKGWISREDAIELACQYVRDQRQQNT